MRKELLIAVVIGLFFGIIIGFGIWRANNAINNDQISTEATPTDVQNTLVENTEQADPSIKDDGLIISSPLDYDVVTSSSVIIKGLSNPKSKVIISAENKDYLVETTDKGDFEVAVDLVDGLNQIFITEANFNQEPKTLKIVYSKDFNI